MRSDYLDALVRDLTRAGWSLHCDQPRFRYPPGLG